MSDLARQQQQQQQEQSSASTITTHKGFNHTTSETKVIPVKGNLSRRVNKGQQQLF